MFFINRFDGFIGGAVSPNLECKSSQSSGRPSSYPRAQIAKPTSADDIDAMKVILLKK